MDRSFNGRRAMSMQTDPLPAGYASTMQQFHFLQLPVPGSAQGA
jgi:hypothetical protein